MNDCVCDCTDLLESIEPDTEAGYGLDGTMSYQEHLTYLGGLSYLDARVYEARLEVKRLSENIKHYQKELAERVEFIDAIERNLEVPV